LPGSGSAARDCPARRAAADGLAGVLLSIDQNVVSRSPLGRGPGVDV